VAHSGASAKSHDLEVKEDQAATTFSLWVLIKSGS